MKRYYVVECRACGKKIRYDRLNPAKCTCGSKIAHYKGVCVYIGPNLPTRAEKALGT